MVIMLVLVLGNILGKNLLTSQSSSKYKETLGQSLIVGCFLLPSFCFFLFLFFFNALPLPEIERQTPIYSLQTGIVQDGNFLLGTGYIQSDMYYYFYKDTGKNTKVLAKSKTDITEIRNTNDSKPYLLTYSKHLKLPTWIQWAFYPITDFESPFALSRIVLVVPENALLEKYDLNKE